MKPEDGPLLQTEYVQSAFCIVIQSEAKDPYKSARLVAPEGFSHHDVGGLAPQIW
jgi:hypothetical protein